MPQDKLYDRKPVKNIKRCEYFHFNTRCEHAAVARWRLNGGDNWSHFCHDHDELLSQIEAKEIRKSKTRDALLDAVETAKQSIADSMDKNINAPINAPEV